MFWANYNTMWKHLGTTINRFSTRFSWSKWDQSFFKSWPLDEDRAIGYWWRIEESDGVRYRDKISDLFQGDCRVPVTDYFIHTPYTKFHTLSMSGLSTTWKVLFKTDLWSNAQDSCQIFRISARSLFSLEEAEGRQLFEAFQGGVKCLLEFWGKILKWWLCSARTIHHWQSVASAQGEMVKSFCFQGKLLLRRQISGSVHSLGWLQSQGF